MGVKRQKGESGRDLKGRSLINATCGNASENDGKYTSYARLKVPRSRILKEIKEKRRIRWPKPIKASPKRMDQGLYYTFYKDIGHDTDNCRHLKVKIDCLGG